MPTPPDLSAFRTPAATGRPPRGLRLGLAAALAVVWFAVLGLGGPVFGAIGDVSSNDQATFLPASAESTRAGEEAAAFQDGEAVPAVVVGPASTADPAAAFPALADLAGRLGEVPGVTDVAGPIPSDDGAAVQFLAFVDSSAGAERPVADVVADLREVVADPAAADPALAGTVAADTEWHVGGPAGLVAELGGAFAGIDGLLLLVALVVVFVILVAVYRSVLLPVLVLLTAVAALCGAIVAVYGMALAGWIQLNGQAQGILSILVIGAATDYCLLLVARHREELLVRADVGEALRAAVRGSFGAITASASTVALALLILMASDLNSTRSLGPVAATGVAFAWLAALTLLPALLRLTGRAAFWPTIPSPERARRRTERRAARGRAFTPPRDGAGRPIAGLEEDHGVWTRVGAVVARRPRLVWVATTVVLLALCGGLLQLRADGVAQEDVLLGDSDARQAQALLSEHFDAGAGAPAQILAPAEDAEPIYGKTYLPRKFKTTVVIPPQNDVDLHANDMNFVAIAENGKLVGFNLLVGGGLSIEHGNKKTYARTASEFGYLPLEHTLAVAEAVVTTQRDWGNRTDRKNAKTKYTLERVGVETFKAEVERRAGIKFEPIRPYEFTGRGDRIGWVKGIDNNWHLTLFIENGRILDYPGRPLKTGLLKIAKIHKGEFRITANQNLIIASVPEDQKAKIEKLAGASVWHSASAEAIFIGCCLNMICAWRSPVMNSATPETMVIHNASLVTGRQRSRASFSRSSGVASTWLGEVRGSCTPATIAVCSPAIAPTPA